MKLLGVAVALLLIPAAIAAWAADQYRLGKRAYARHVLRREVRRGSCRSRRPAASSSPSSTAS